MNTWDTVAFGSMFLAGSRNNGITTGHVVYRGTDGEAARRLQYAFAARLNKWKRSYSVYLLKDGRPVGSVAR